MPVVKDAVGDGSQLDVRIAAVRSALDALERDIKHREKGAGKATRRSEENESRNASLAKLEQELRRTKQELAQRRIELSDVRKEAARALQRAEQENERLRQELLVAQRFMQDALSSQPPAASKTRRASEPPKQSPAEDVERASTPVASGRKSRQSADTLRPHARTRGR